MSSTADRASTSPNYAAGNSQPASTPSSGISLDTVFSYIKTFGDAAVSGSNQYASIRNNLNGGSWNTTGIIPTYQNPTNSPLFVGNTNNPTTAVTDKKTDWMPIALVAGAVVLAIALLKG